MTDELVTPREEAADPVDLLFQAIHPGNDLNALLTDHLWGIHGVNVRAGTPVEEVVARHAAEDHTPETGDDDRPGCWVDHDPDEFYVGWWLRLSGAAPLTVERLERALCSMSVGHYRGWDVAGMGESAHMGMAAEHPHRDDATAILAALAVAPPSASDVQTDDLGAAWAEAEAALPDGWIMEKVQYIGGGWQAVATDWWNGGRETTTISGPTPAASLRALAAKLRTPQPEPK